MDLFESGIAFIFDHPIATVLGMAILLGLPLALISGRRMNALLEGLQARYGGSIIKRRISPSELRITTEGRLVIFGASLGSRHRIAPFGRGCPAGLAVVTPRGAAAGQDRSRSRAGARC